MISSHKPRSRKHLPFSLVQTGAVHALACLLRKVLIRGAVLGVLRAEGADEESGAPSAASAAKAAGRKASAEPHDYDSDHDGACPPVMPLAVARALAVLIGACCGPCYRYVLFRRCLGSCLGGRP